MANRVYFLLDNAVIIEKGWRVLNMILSQRESKKNGRFPLSPIIGAKLGATDARENKFIT